MRDEKEDMSLVRKETVNWKGSFSIPGYATWLNEFGSFVPIIKEPSEGRMCSYLGVGHLERIQCSKLWEW